MAYLFSSTDAPLNLSNNAPIDQARQHQTRSRIKDLFLCRTVTFVLGGTNNRFRIEGDTLSFVKITISGRQRRSRGGIIWSGLVESRG